MTARRVSTPSEVTYEDGGKGKITATLEICDVQVAAASTNISGIEGSRVKDTETGYVTEDGHHWWGADGNEEHHP